ncbi:hypothetical protein CAL7716_059170 [Calothrix sp. PCC 7716]|nr:hypothetical protein CAL7716_059170 [Calothrix sp. PCC 7716]
MAIQKILFGSPGTGKSYKVRQIAKQELKITFDTYNNTSQNLVKTVFHPEYTYSDFMGKLLPLTAGNNIVYKYYPGHFLQALGKAYRALIDGKDNNYLLVIDELNRGNAAAIFGPIFQLLDRESSGWSSYEVNISEMEFIGLLKAMDYKVEVLSSNDIKDIKVEGTFFNEYLKNKRDYLDDINTLEVLECIETFKLKIPPNLSIIGTINTSDESIYCLDSAFKRRWDWEYIEAPNALDILRNNVPQEIAQINIETIWDTELKWYRCVVGINEFIKSNYQYIRRIEDKQLGWWFVKPKNQNIRLEEVRDKVMFYLWDTVFARDKKPLIKLFEEKLECNTNLATYSDFANRINIFLNYMHNSAPILPELNDDDIMF